jgi:hypothetical protein
MSADTKTRRQLSVADDGPDIPQTRPTEPAVSEMVLRAGESLTRPGYCAMCGETPCEMAGAESVFTAQELCYLTAWPQDLLEWAKRTVHLLLNDLDLPDSTGEWMPGTSDMLRAVAAELTQWADRGERAARHREAASSTEAYHARVRALSDERRRLLS